MNKVYNSNAVRRTTNIQWFAKEKNNFSDCMYIHVIFFSGNIVKKTADVELNCSIPAVYDLIAEVKVCLSIPVLFQLLQTVL